MKNGEFRKLLREEFRLAGVFCLTEEEKVILKDLIQIGKWIKHGMLFCITIGITGISALSAAILIGYKLAPLILKLMEIP